jgi:protein phosphatase
VGTHYSYLRVTMIHCYYLVAAADRLSNPEMCAEAIEGANQHLYTLMEQ